MIITVPKPSKENIVGATQREQIFFDGIYPMEVVPLGGRFDGRVPFSVIRLLPFLSFGGFPMV